MGKQDTFTQQTLIPCCELDFGDSECMSEVQRSIHIRVRIVPKPLGKLLADLCTSETCGFFLRWGIDFEDVLPFPVMLVLLFQGLQIVPLAGLPMERIISDRADDTKGRGNTWASSRVFDIYVEAENGLDSTVILQQLRERNTRCQSACIVPGVG